METTKGFTTPTPMVNARRTKMKMISLDEDDFSFQCTNPDRLPISADDIFQTGQIRPVFLIFNRDLIFADADNGDSSRARRAAASSSSLWPPLKKPFFEERDTPSSSESKSNQLERITEGTFCKWSRKPVVVAQEQFDGRFNSNLDQYIFQGLTKTKCTVHVEAEVSRLEELKSSKMKELVKKSELVEIFRKTHMFLEANGAIDYIIEAIDSGDVDPACVLDQIELQVEKVKEEALSRK